MNGDALVERAAVRLEERARGLARRNGLRAKLAAELEQDAEFLRRLKPSLVRARLRESPPAAGNGAGHAGGLRERLEAERAEARELFGKMKPREMAARVGGPEKKPKPPSGGEGGGAKQALLVVGASLAAGILLARLLDWRGHAHPQL